MRKLNVEGNQLAEQSVIQSVYHLEYLIELRVGNPALFNSLKGGSLQPQRMIRIDGIDHKINRSVVAVGAGGPSGGSVQINK